MRQAEEIEALAARTSALETVWRQVDRGSREAVASVRRIIRSVELSLETYAATDLADMARRARGADPEELDELVPELVRSIREAMGEIPREAVRILLVDDDTDEVSRLEELLAGPTREIRVCASVEEAEQSLSPEPPDLVVVRLELEASDGRDLLLSLLSRPTTAAVPAIVLTSRDDPAIRAECFALGADELLDLPVEKEILSAAVSSLLRRRASLTRLAQEDYLTGLPNRAAFARIYGRLQSLAERNDEPLTLALLDVDFLKDVNDRLGHPAGDRVLEDLARVVEDALRDSDVLARWGGDEFVVLLPRTGVTGAEEALDKARRAFRRAAARDPGLGRDGRRVSFSAGITPVRHSEAVEEAVARADHLLYQAKAGGRDHVATRPVDELEVPDVLLVEDDDAVATVLHRFLDGAGFRVRRVTDGEAALAEVRASRPDLMVLDIMLPGRDGFDVLEEVRDDVELQDVPVLILTALGQEEAVVRGFSLGVDEYLVKPVARERFLSKVRQLVRP